jgi:hypothetical protein
MQELFLQCLTEQSAKVMEASKHKSLTYSDAGACAGLGAYDCCSGARAGL